MSTRNLRKIERQRFENNTPDTLDSQDHSDEDVPKAIHPAQTKAFNAFALLNGNSDGSDTNDISDNEEIKANEELSYSEPQKSKSSKKKKNKKGKKKKPVVDSDDELDSFLAEIKQKYNEDVPDSKNVAGKLQDDQYNFEEEFDMVVDPIDEYDSNFKYFTSTKLKRCLRLLSIESVKSLDMDEELKNLFGNLSTESIEDASASTSLSITPDVLAQFKKIAKLTRGWGGKDRRSVPGTARKLLLTRIKDDWLPTSQKPLSQLNLKPDEIIKYFNYKEDTLEYDEMQYKLEKEMSLGIKYFNFDDIRSVQSRIATTKFYTSLMAITDPNDLFKLLQEHPYHVETLLQVAMVLLRQNNEKSTSNALIEKALFVFDRSFEKTFHELLSQGKNELIRLPYESFYNRQFYLCIFRWITSLGDRSTFFTALSFCKLLLSLSPAEDPLGVRYFIDFYAILSEEYEYLIKFVDSPLVNTYNRWYTPGLAFSVVLAHLNLDDKIKAELALKLAFDRHPYVAYRLLKVFGLEADVSVKESDLPTNDEILISAETYLTRAKILWTNSEHREFLRQNLVKYFHDASLNSNKSKSFASSFYSWLGLKDSEEHVEIPFNLLRFSILSGETQIMAKIPEYIWSRKDTYEYDVLPPKDSTVVYNEFTGISNNGDSVVTLVTDYVDRELLDTIRAEEESYNSLLSLLQTNLMEDPMPGA